MRERTVQNVLNNLHVRYVSREGGRVVSGSVVRGVWGGVGVHYGEGRRPGELNSIVLDI